MSLQVNTTTFAGVDLKVITGHPEHALLFIAKQVADAAGLKDASKSISKFFKLKGNEGPIKVSDLNVWTNSQDTIEAIIDYPRVQPRSILMTEPQVYKMLMRGHAPQSEKFRNWVTEEVLPTIRKTGRYDINESTTAEAIQFRKEFDMLAGMMKAMSDRMENIEKILQNQQSKQAVIDVYEGRGRTTVYDYLDMNKANVKRQGEAIGLGGYVVNKLLPALALEVEKRIAELWKEHDGRKLQTRTSKAGNVWSIYPIAFVQSSVTAFMLKSILTELNK